MNPKQRRGAITLIVAALGAIAVFIAVVSFVGSVNAEVGPKTKVYKAAQDIPLNKEIDPATDLDAVDLPNKYVSPQMVTELEQFAGQKANADIKRGSFLQTDQLEAISNLKDGEREITINFDADRGINGRVRPGDNVDVVAAFAKDREQANAGGDYRRADIPYNVAGTLVPNARVISVGQPKMEGDQAQAGRPGEEALVETVAVTFAVSSRNASRLAYGESFAVSMRIVRSGNNETGEKVHPRDRYFEDTDLPKTLGSTESK